MLAVRDRRTEHAVGPAPDEPSRPRVEGVGPAVPASRGARGVAAAARARGEIDEPVDDARRAVDRGRALEAPDPVSGSRVERHEEPVVGSDEDAPPPDRGRGVDVIAGALSPQQPSAGGAEGIQGAVGVPDEDPAVRDRRRGVEELAAPEACECLRAPAQPSSAGVQRIEAAAVGAEVDLSVRERRRAIDLGVRGERPAGLAGVDVDRVELAIPRSDVEGLSDDEGRRLEDAGPVAPDDLPGPSRHRHDLPGLIPWVAVAGQRLHPRVVDDAVGDSRRRSRAVAELPLPDHLAGAVVDGEEPPALLREVEAAVRDRGRKLEHVARLERPAQPERRAELEVLGGVRALHAQAVRRPRETEDDAARPRRLGRLRLLRRHELHRRRAPLVFDRRLLVEPDAGEEAGDRGGERNACDGEDPVPVHGLRTTTSAASRRPETSTTSE